MSVVGGAGGDGDLDGRSFVRDEPDVRVWVEAAGGFGVPNAIVRDVLASASGPVDTGPCTR